MSIKRRFFLRAASDPREYLKDVVPTGEFVSQLREIGIDVFSFIERKWCFTLPDPPSSWLKASDNIALLQLSSYEEWLKRIGKKTRNMIRKAERIGIATETVKPDQKLIAGIWRIFNETPVRQGRGFPYYGVSSKTVEQILLMWQECATYLGAYYQNELVGFIQLVHGNSISGINQILSMQEHWDKAINNALVAEAVKVCADRGEKWLMYGRMGNHPSLDRFKRSNGCIRFPLTRYHILLSRRGRIAARLGLHRELKDALPSSAKAPLFPIYNWLSRNRMRLRMKKEF